MPYPSKLTPETHERIVGLLRAGNYLETAASVAGVSSRAVRKWMVRGDAGEEPFATFAQDVRKAIAESEAHDVVQLAKLAKEGDAKAIQWRLERRHRERWGSQIKVVTEVREQAVEEILGRLRERLDPRAFQAVLLALSDREDGDEAGGEPRIH